jgi:hypothetical protein
MNIGFYGHSAASWINSPNDASFVDKLCKRYDAKIVNLGVNQGSEERILHALKKTKKLDYAVVFHSSPKFVFLPTCNRDVKLDNVVSKGNYLWEDVTQKDPISKEQFEQLNFGSANSIVDVFGEVDNYVDALLTYKKYFFDPDAMMNRFQASMLLTDHYLKNMQIKAFHFVHPKILPSWMHFESGPVNTDFDIRSRNVESKLPNGIDVELNDYVFGVLSQWIDSNK